MTATLQSATDALNAAAIAYNGKIDEINLALASLLSSADGTFVAQHASVSQSGGDAVVGENLRDFNTVVKPLDGVSLSGGQMALTAGKYTIDGFFKVYRVNFHSFLLRDLSENVDHVLCSGHSGAAANSNECSAFKWFLDIDSDRSFNFINNVQSAKVDNGLGLGGVTSNNIYAGLIIRRVG